MRCQHSTKRTVCTVNPDALNLLMQAACTGVTTLKEHRVQSDIFYLAPFGKAGWLISRVIGRVTKDTWARYNNVQTHDLYCIVPPARYYSVLKFQVLSS